MSEDVEVVINGDQIRRVEAIGDKLTVTFAGGEAEEYAAVTALNWSAQPSIRYPDIVLAAAAEQTWTRADRQPMEGAAQEYREKWGEEPDFYVKQKRGEQ